MRLRQFYIILLILILPDVSRAHTGNLFSKDIWLNETNVPVKINCLAKDEIGHIWLGTDEGLYRYNGRNFTYIETRSHEAVTSIAVDGNRLIAGFDKGAFGVWNGEAFYLTKAFGNKPNEAISSIYVVAANVWLLSTDGEGVFVANDGYCTQYNMDSGLTDDYVYTILSPRKNLLLAATDQGINEIKINKGGFKVTPFNTSNGLPDNIVRVIKPMAEKCWSWIGTHQGGVALYCSKSRTTWTPQTKKKWEWGQVNDILPVGDNMAWVCTESGHLLKLILYGEDSLDIQSHYFPGQKLYRMLMGETGNIWCATNAGLKVIVADYLTSIQLAEPYSVQQLSAMTCDNNSGLWFSQKDKLFRISIEENNSRPQVKFVCESPITDLYYDKKGRLWVGTFGKGLWYSDDYTHFNKINDVNKLRNESILDIDGLDDDLWIAGLNGVEELRVEPDNKLSLLRVHNKSTGIGSDYIYKLFPDSRGNVWMATDGAGVCMYANGVYSHWDSTDGMNSRVTYNITEDKLGNIWASTFDKGLLVYDGSYWRNINRENGLQSLKISTVVSTINNQVLVVHAKGIDEWHPNSNEFRHYERKLGIGIDTVSAALNLSAKDTSGNVYIPYQGGLLRFGENNVPTKLTPSIFIKSLKTFFRETRREQNKFKHTENHITFSYEGVSFANPEQLFYRYKLEGYNEEWIITRDESVTFPQLTDGDYRFVVQVSMNSLFSSYGEGVHAFSIAKPYWQEVWFILLMLLLLWGIAYAYIRVREQNLRKLSSLQKERMMFEYEHLKSQVNPHFLFNSLNTLTGLIEDDQQQAITYTTQLSDLYRNMLSHKDKDLVSLADEWKILQNYIYIQKSRFGEALQLIVNIPDNVKEKRVVPMALQLLLENAIKHNIVSKTKPLIVKFEVVEGQLSVSNNYQPKMSKEKGAGLGLANIRKRYMLHTKAQVLSRIENDEFIVIIPLI